MQCDLCGSEEELFLAEIEGTKLNVCKNCSRFGKIIGKTKTEGTQKIKRTEKIMAVPEKEIVQIITKDYSNLIKEKRESLGLKQKELAKKIAEKESVIHKVESGHVEPSISLARKLEKTLGIRLIEEEKVEKVTKEKTKDSGITIGDLFKSKS